MKKLCLLIIFSYQLAVAFSQNTLPANRSVGSGDFLYQKGVEQYFIDFDSSIYFFQKAIPYLKAADEWEKFIDCYNYLSVLSYQKGAFKKARKLIHTVEKEITSLPIKTTAIQSILINNKGVYYHKLGNYQQAIQYFEKTLNTSLPSAFLMTTLFNIGSCYEKIGDPDKAISYYEQVLDKTENGQQLKPEEKVNLYNAIGNCWKKKGSNKKAKVNYRKAQQHLEYLPAGDFHLNQKVALLNCFAEIHAQEKEWREALMKTHQAIDLQLLNPKIKHRFLAYSNLAKISTLKQKDKEAEKAYQLAIGEVLKEYSDFNKHPFIAGRYREMADFHLKKENLPTALTSYQKALIHLSLDFDQTEFHYNPDMDAIIAAGEGIRILEGKARTLIQLFSQNGLVADLELALNCYILAEQLIHRLRQELNSEMSKQQIAAQNSRVLEGGIRTALRLFERTGREKYLQQAWLFTESNKAMLLLESLYKNRAVNYGGLPDDIFEDEQRLSFEISFYQKKINQELQRIGSGNSKLLTQWKNRLFRVEKEYQKLTKILEEHYPRYYQLKYNNEIASPEVIQRKVLDPESVLLEYFAGKEDYYLFCLSSSGLQFRTLPKARLKEELIRELLFKLHAPSSDRKSLKSFTDLSNEVFKIFLQDGLEMISKETRRLIIIPDGPLCYLPFEVLIKETPQILQDYQATSLAYLINDHKISYAYSATFLLQSLIKEVQPSPSSLLAMAPSYSSNAFFASDESRQKLPNSKKEVEAILKYWEGTIISGEKATKDKFISEASDHRILHLATHSSANLNNHLLSKIYFSDGHLTSYDLLDLPLRSELVVLSSCNSGTGPFLEGEGIVSISWAFHQAGIPSTLISLWSVDDYATSEIMREYYRLLQLEKDKAEALRQAKMLFIKQTDKARQHPFYWAGFIQMGNFLPLDGLDDSRSFNWSFLWIGLLVLLFFYWRKRRIHHL